MGEPKVTSKALLYLSIEDQEDVGYEYKSFEWMSFTNGGYVVRAEINDPGWNILKQYATEEYLSSGRKKPTKVVWELEWGGSTAEKKKTGKHQGFIVDLDARGINKGGTLEFIAVDPPSFWLNAGDSSGKVYEGTAKEVIEKVIDEYFIEKNASYGGGARVVSEVGGNKKMKWPMMRMDPKTFISSILDWSASITDKKTNWIVSSGGSIEEKPTIWVREQGERPSRNYGVYVMDANTPSANDIKNFQYLSDNFVSVFQKQLTTQGISAISGKFYDVVTDQEQKQVYVRDENTSEKKKPNITAAQGFAKPTTGKNPEWSTAIMAVPQFNAGDLGIKYGDYIDGRARGMFLNMLNLVMRIKISVSGEPDPMFSDSHYLGVSKLKIIWLDVDGNPYFLDGDWLVYGFHHQATRNGWWTDIYCARLDHNSNANII